jgi:hypothetical protein
MGMVVISINVGRATCCHVWAFCWLFIMNFRIVSSVSAFLLLFLSGSVTARGGSKTLMVHYMPWFVSQPFSGSWGWHWTMNYFNPNVLNPTNGEQQIASWYYPLIGPYDSADPAVLEYHVLLMKLGGVDGVIVDWYGMDNFNDYAINNTRTLDLFNYTRKAGLKFSLCYEDATIQQEINGGFITAAGAIAHAQQTMLYAQSNFFTDPSFLRWHASPVLLNFGPQYFLTSSGWASNFSVLNVTNQPAFFTEDNRLPPAGTGAFDWPPMSLSQTNAQSPTEPVLSDAVMNSYLASFDQTAGAWPAFVSSAFPRFHDIYAQAGVKPSYGYLDDQNGATFQETLTRALTNASTYIQVVTWNDFGEGTIVEPTVQYGYRDLGVIQNFRRQYLDAGFSFHTNDLFLPLRLYNLRKKYGATNADLASELDRVFTNVVSSNLTTASLQLTGLESGVPVIYNASVTASQLQFTIGGFISGARIQVQSAPTLAAGGWQTVTNLSVGTNLTVFSAFMPPDSPAMFFKIQTAAP